MMGEILDTDYALLPQDPSACIIETGEGFAKITNGKLTLNLYLLPVVGEKITEKLHSINRTALSYSAISMKRMVPALGQDGFVPAAAAVTA